MKKYTYSYYKEHSKKYYDKNKKKILKHGAKYRKDKLPEQQKLLNELKLNGCSICGYDKYIGSLDFHHVDEKKPIIYLNLNGMKWGNYKIITEFHKCMLLCKNCHYEIHGNGDSL